MSSLIDIDWTDSDIEKIRDKVDVLAHEVQDLVVDRLMRDFSQQELEKIEDMYGTQFTYRMFPSHDPDAGLLGVGVTTCSSSVPLPPPHAVSTKIRGMSFFISVKYPLSMVVRVSTASQEACDM